MGSDRAKSLFIKWVNEDRGTKIGAVQNLCASFGGLKNWLHDICVDPIPVALFTESSQRRHKKYMFLGIPGRILLTEASAVKLQDELSRWHAFDLCLS
jgi:hypothetical protein